MSEYPDTEGDAIVTLVTGRMPRAALPRRPACGGPLKIVIIGTYATFRTASSFE